ncbi:MAG: phosphatidate cytidylyltransferase [Bacteroidales bacterium]|nr:phosphatidate cytidylyltransferase [Bacteroidales bacterium]BDX38285.1 hypothetical protein CYCD_16400 [Tenuifilaceae bacterium CYCD]
MNSNTIILTCIYLVGLAVLLIFNEINYRRLKVKGEISRKFAHFAATLCTIPLPYVFSSHWYVFILAVIFALVLFITQKGHLLQSIHDVERKSIGSYLLPISIYVTFFVSKYFESRLMYVLPILILAISDPMAAIVGIGMKKYNHRIKIFGIDTQKSMFGSGAFLLSSLLVCLMALYFNRRVFDETTIVISLTIAVVSTIVELFSRRGLDNLLVPISVILVLLFLN